jgi:hypothetical protein
LQSRRERTIPRRAALDASGRARRAPASLSSLRSSRYRARTLVLALAWNQCCAAGRIVTLPALARSANCFSVCSRAFAIGWRVPCSAARLCFARCLRILRSLAPILSPPGVLVRSGHARYAVADDAAPPRVPGKPALVHWRASGQQAHQPAPGRARAKSKKNLMARGSAHTIGTPAESPSGIPTFSSLSLAFCRQAHRSWIPALWRSAEILQASP